MSPSMELAISIVTRHRDAAQAAFLEKYRLDENSAVQVAHSYGDARVAESAEAILVELLAIEPTETGA